MTDTHSGSRRHDVWEELKAQTTDKVPNAAKRFATLRLEANTAEATLRTLFERYESTRATLEENGIVAQMKLSPMLSAAHGAWLRDRDVPRRLELSEVSEAPIPPEEHGGQGRGLKLKDSEGRALCGRCGKPYDGRTGHGPGSCARAEAEDVR